MPDIYADIAAKRFSEREKELIEPQPAQVPRRILPLDETPGLTRFPAFTKMDTWDALHAELESQRVRHSPYLENHAPDIESGRITTRLGSFDWRIESDADRSDFSSALRGDGPWEKVSIPHYGPPLGRAVTFYRTTFELTPAMLEKGALFISFKGVDYIAHVFVNNAFLGSHQGFFAPFQFEFTRHARPGENVLLVRVDNDFIHMGSRSESSETRYQGDKLYAATGCGYDDPAIGWHHCPPGMGIYQDVFVDARTRLHLHDIFVRPLPESESAEVWVEIFNCDVNPTKVLLELSLYGQNFQQVIFEQLTYQPAGIHVPGLGDVAKRTGKEIPLLMGPGVNLLKIPIAIPAPRLWEPASPWLYQIQVRLLDEGGHILDAGSRQFGMRSFRMDDQNEPRGRYFLNGRPIKLRGANTMGHLQQCVLKRNWDQLRDDILLAKICNMNFLRLTQRPVQPEIYDFCDRLGLMTQTDLPLFGVLRRNQFSEAVRQAEEMERLIRNHACAIQISYINEPFPNAMDEPHRHLLRGELQHFFEAADSVVKMNNPDRVIKAVDGDYDPPGPGLPDNHCYCGWYNGHGLDLGKLHKGYWQKVKPGWNYGCGEFGAEGLDPVDVMRTYYPREWLPQNPDQEKSWTPNNIVMAQTGRFHYLWFDTPHTLKDWVAASLAHQAWVTRLMTQAFRRNNGMHSFAIHLFIDAFPSGWMKAIMDVERRPKPAYFAYRDALTQVMVSLRSDRTAFFSGETIAVEVWICNDLSEPIADAALAYTVELENTPIHNGTTRLDVPAFQSVCHGHLQFRAPDVSARQRLTVRLAVSDRSGQALHTTEAAFGIFKPMERAARPAVHIISTHPERLAQFARSLGLDPAGDQTLAAPQRILIDDFSTFRAQQQSIQSAVQEGAIAIFFELPPGTHQIAGTEIVVTECGMGARHFVSRATHHPMVQEFLPEDFKFWYDAGVDYPTPLLYSTFTAPGWTPILTSGNGDWQGDWSAAFAAAEKKQGAGHWRICQVQLMDRLEGNPAATMFAMNLLETRRNRSQGDLNKNG